MSTSIESMLLSLSAAAPPDMGAVSKKEHYLTDRSDVISEVPKCSKIQISPAPPKTQVREVTSLPRPPSWWVGDSLPLTNNPTPIVSPSIRAAWLLRVSGVYPITELSTACINMIYYAINTQ